MGACAGPWLLTALRAWLLTCSWLSLLLLLLLFLLLLLLLLFLLLQVSQGYQAVLMDFGSARPMPIQVTSRAQALTVQEDAEVGRNL
jgi:hypothetical protein